MPDRPVHHAAPGARHPLADLTIVAPWRIVAWANGRWSAYDERRGCS
ncbi:MAG: hypothetical protein JRI68_00875 [Deltaproteobacteria bacterium]|nr:hypothetical protein [Deltaproteobacteria bacterium]